MATTKIKKKEDKGKYIGTGCTLLDLNVGGKRNRFGYPAGKIINIVGDKSSGKTFICCEIIASAYHKYGNKLKWVYDDSESGFTFNTKKLYGFEIMPVDETQRTHSTTVQEMSGNFRKFLKTIDEENGEFGIYVIDSLDGLSSNELEKIADARQKAYEKDTEYKQGSYQMESAKFLSQEFFRTLAGQIEHKNVLLIFVSQVRHNPDPFSMKKWTRAGGKALDFYAYSCLWLQTLKKLKKAGRVNGVMIRAISDKLKAPRPFREIEFSMYFDYGIDDIGSNLDYLYDLRHKKEWTLKAAANKCVWEGEEYTRDELVEMFDSGELNPKLLRRKVIERWEELEKEAASNRSGKYAKKVKTNVSTTEDNATSNDSENGDRALVKKRGRPPKKSTKSTD